MEKRRPAAISQHVDKDWNAAKRGSRGDEEKERASEEGDKAAKDAFGNFGDLLIKQKQKRSK